jgi:hypothetical protein
VIVLLGFLQCQQARTLSGLQRSVAKAGSLSGLSHFLAKAPWETEALVERWQERFRRQMTPVAQAEHTRQQEEQPKRRGRPKLPVVTGYLIGDDSTMHKEKGRKMEGIGKHHSTTHERRVRGHSPSRTPAHPTDGDGNDLMSTPPRSRLRITPNSAGRVASG